MNQLTASPADAHLHRTDRLIAVALAVLAGIWHGRLMTRATNDNFLHLTFAQQWLHGDWPVRDFFDQGWVLQYSLSTIAHLLFGQRLGAEAVIVGTAWAVSTYLIYITVRRLTGSTSIAIASALLPILASARGYSYPKGIVYAVAATLWWRYVDHPSTRRIVAFGAWAAVAFYWRPDHGIYVAIGLTLAVVAAHGLNRVTIARCATAAATMIACILPFLLYVQLMYGLPAYVQTGLVQAEVEHGSHGTHEWPLIRYASSLVTFEPVEHFAPTIGVRWRRDSSPAERREVRARYGMVPVGDDGGVERVRLSADSISKVRTLINEPLIDDTAGIDRSAGTLSEKDWPSWQRRKFDYRWLRVQILPTLDAQARASEITAAMFFAFPLALLIGAPWIARRLDHPSPLAFAAFATFALLVAWAMVRNPFAARVADAVVLSSIAFGCCLGALWRPRASRFRTAIARSSSMATCVLALLTVGIAGRFESPIRWVSGGTEAYREMSASPPLAFYVGRSARFTLRLAAYVRDCVPADERLLVLWFEPEIYYYADRLMAQRHAVFAPAWSTLEHEQRVTLEKITRFAPPLVLARQSALDEYARATYPGVIDYVAREYSLAATVDDGGERYLIYARRDRPALRTFATQEWPCYTPQPSLWARVGVESAAR